MKEILVAFYDPEFDSDRFEAAAEEVAQAFPDVISFGCSDGEAEMVLECPLERLAEILHQVRQFPNPRFTEMGFPEEDGDVQERVALPSASYIVGHVIPG